MTDLYEALRAAIAPDGRVRLTLPLLTAMREENERRERGEGVPTLVIARDVTFSPVDSTLRERAETAERELAEARLGYDTVTAALEGGTGDPLAHALRRAEKAERERDEALARIKAAGDVVSDNGCDCACDHATMHEDHDEDCEVCVVCRVADALWPEVSR